MPLDRSRLEDALELLGQHLHRAGTALELVAIGGSGLLLLGFIERPTRDVDIIAFATGSGYLRADRMPPELIEARNAVADHLDLEPDWLNSAPRSLINPALPNQGLPAGFAERVVRRAFGEGLVLHLAGRFDQICFKLHAAVDRADPEGRHVQDLRALAPTRDELLSAARWTRLHDPSEGFRQMLVEALVFLGVDDAASELAPNE